MALRAEQEAILEAEQEAERIAQLKIQEETQRMAEQEALLRRKQEIEHEKEMMMVVLQRRNQTVRSLSRKLNQSRPKKSSTPISNFTA